MTPALNTFFKQYRLHIDTQLQLHLPPRVHGGERLLEAMSYSLLNGGKRVRPILAYASSVACNADTPSPILDATACALECIHAYSLIHDDLPSMDDDDLRRGKPTCHIQFDEATAVLAGDALQCHAFDILSNNPSAASTIIQLIRELARASGASGMVVGQAIDLAAVNGSPSIDLLESMHTHKTGALIEASVVMGAIASGNEDRSTLEALRRYSRAIGLSFQVQDDILDVTADTQTLGKKQGSDIERNKPTYVSLLGLDGARKKAADLHSLAITALQGFDHKADMLRDLSSYIIQREA